jgi:chemotaxis protein MotB
MANVAPTIIIKRPKVVAGGGHHGGAWKVAYADFVTAMMAFFLLMWLLNATTEEQRKGIADYFNPTIPIASQSGGGSDALQGDTVHASAKLVKEKRQTDEQATQSHKDATAAEQDSAARKMEDELNASLAAATDGLSEHISLRVTKEGIVIEITDRDQRPLFRSGSAEPSSTLTELCAIVADALKDVGNPLKIVGHTDSFAFPQGSNYSNWELSSDRSNTARRLLAEAGFPNNRIVEVSGRASVEPLVDDPLDPRNRRISITLLR